MYKRLIWNRKEKKIKENKQELCVRYKWRERERRENEINGNIHKGKAYRSCNNGNRTIKGMEKQE